MTLPAELCIDNLCEMVQAAADNVDCPEGMANTIAAEFKGLLEVEMGELGGNRLVVVRVATEKKASEQKCIYCTTPVAWDDSPDPQCVPRCSP